MTPFVCELLLAPTAHASERPAVHTANSGNASPTPTPGLTAAPDQSRPVALPVATAPVASHAQAGSTAPAQPLQSSTAPAAGPNTLRPEVFGRAYSGNLRDPYIGYPSWNVDHL